MRRFVTSAVAALAAAVVSGQTPAPKFAFEVASVKAAEPAARSGFKSTGMPPPLSGDPSHLTYTGVSLAGVLMRAYDVKPLRIDGPDWLRTELYDISAKVPDDAPRGHIPEMLQALLAERFRMTVHWETRDETGYALVVGKNEPKFKKSETTESGAPPNRTSSMSGSGHLTWKASTLDDIATSLSIFMGRPVVDKTGISGIFDMTIDAAPDSMPGFLSRSSDAAESPNPSIFAAVREQGLNLEPGKVSVRRLVVDSAQKVPTAN